MPAGSSVCPVRLPSSYIKKIISPFGFDVPAVVFKGNKVNATCSLLSIDNPDTPAILTFKLPFPSPK